MALSFAKRIVGYGCWNLHFDRELGKFGSVTNNQTLLTFLRSLYQKINHIKVILFRNTAADKLTSDRAIPLYRHDATINQVLIDNLKHLIDEANLKGFWVQICIWHHQALTDPGEYPENAPGVLAPDWSEPSIPGRLQKYYMPSASRQAAFAEHRKLFDRIGREFGGYDNVIFELGNELRIWPTVDTSGKAGDERNLKAWLTGNLEALRAAASPRPIRVCTSSGIANEYILFKPPGGLDVDYYDFHSGQWGMTDANGNPDRNSTKYPAGIRGCRDNAATYKPGAKVLINTDGLFRSTDTVENSGAFAQLMQNWVGEAFQKGVSFVTKGFYPPGVSNISKPMLDALEHAANSIPEP
jgi:hypothetical protein